MGWEEQIMRKTAKTRVNNLRDCMKKECSRNILKCLYVWKWSKWKHQLMGAENPDWISLVLMKFLVIGIGYKQKSGWPKIPHQNPQMAYAIPKDITNFL